MPWNQLKDPSGGIPDGRADDGAVSAVQFQNDEIAAVADTVGVSGPGDLGFVPFAVGVVDRKIQRDEVVSVDDRNIKDPCVAVFAVCEGGFDSCIPEFPAPGRDVLFAETVVGASRSAERILIHEEFNAVPQICRVMKIL